MIIIVHWAWPGVLHGILVCDEDNQCGVPDASLFESSCHVRNAPVQLRGRRCCHLIRVVFINTIVSRYCGQGCERIEIDRNDRTTSCVNSDQGPVKSKSSSGGGKKSSLTLLWPEITSAEVGGIASETCARRRTHELECRRVYPSLVLCQRQHEPLRGLGTYRAAVRQVLLSRNGT